MWRIDGGIDRKEEKDYLPLECIIIRIVIVIDIVIVIVVVVVVVVFVIIVVIYRGIFPNQTEIPI